jgi:hypothetical protein
MDSDGMGRRGGREGEEERYDVSGPCFRIFGLTAIEKLRIVEFLTAIQQINEDFA